jgi:hypothetical protein
MMRRHLSMTLSFQLDKALEQHLRRLTEKM